MSAPSRRRARRSREQVGADQDPADAWLLRCATAAKGIGGLCATRQLNGPIAWISWIRWLPRGRSTFAPRSPARARARSSSARRAWSRIRCRSSFRSSPRRAAARCSRTSTATRSSTSRAASAASTSATRTRRRRSGAGADGALLPHGLHDRPLRGLHRARRAADRATPISGPTKAAFFNAGAEAVENAVKFARAYTGRPAVIAFEGGFHGRTLLSLSLTSKTHPYKAGLGPFAPEIYRAPFPHDYRGPTRTPRSRRSSGCSSPTCAPSRSRRS